MKIILYLTLAYVCRASLGQSLTVDIKSEYDNIEASRTLFTQSLKSKDYLPLMKCVTKNFISINPGTVPWKVINEMFEKRGGIPYDSVQMKPIETVIVSDSIAYDFGTRKTYYTNEQGKVVELQDTYLAILKKGKDNIWKMHRDVASGLVEEN